MRRRRAPRLADAHPDPRQQQLPEILRQPAQRRHPRPYRKCDGDEAGAMGGRAVGETGDRYAQHRVEQRKGQPGHQPDLGVIQIQIACNRLGQDVDDLAVDEIEDIDRQQDPQGHPCRLHSCAGAAFCRGCHYRVLSHRWRLVRHPCACPVGAGMTPISKAGAVAPRQPMRPRQVTSWRQGRAAWRQDHRPIRVRPVRH